MHQLPLTASEEKTLRSWNKQDPVDPSEHSRNDAVQRHQGNRNPFVDDADLVDKIKDY